MPVADTEAVQARVDSGLEVIYLTPDFSAPSPQEVAEKLNDKANIIYRDGALVVTVASRVIVKLGAHITPQEAKSMIYVAENTSVPLPTVLSCYTYGPIEMDIDNHGSLFDTYIFMSLVDGETLDVSWDSYDETTKHLSRNNLEPASKSFAA